MWYLVYYMFSICSLVFFVSGWIGNTSCVLTLRVRPLRCSGTAILLRALAITDSVCPGVGLLHLWLCELVSWDVRKMSDVILFFRKRLFWYDLAIMYIQQANILINLSNAVILARTQPSKHKTFV